MEIIINSFGLVALAEMGDKTQLLAFILAAKFKKPWAIIAGIFIATILNHGLASYAGGWISSQISGETLRWVLAATFFIFGIWILIPDKEEELKAESKWGAFLTTVIVFFLAEMGDKTQLATVALAAKYHDIVLVTVGTTLGMVFSNGLAVLAGPALVQKIPVKYVRYFTSFLFLAFAVGILFY